MVGVAVDPPLLALFVLLGLGLLDEEEELVVGAAVAVGCVVADDVGAVVAAVVGTAVAVG